MRLSSLLLCYILTLTQLFAQVPKADFNTSKASYCQGEAVILENKSEFADSYEWDFCEGDLTQGTPQTRSLENSEFNIPIGTSLIKSNGKWYGFICSLNGKSLFRLDFGEALINTTPSIVNLGNLGGQITAPQDIKVIEYNGEYFAFVNNRGSNKLIRINFGSSLENTSVNSDVLVTGGGYTNGGLDVTFDGKSWVVALTNSNYLTLVNLRNSPASIPTASQVINTGIIADVNGIGDIKFVKDDAEWYGFVVGFNSKTTHRLYFGDSLFVNPVSQKLDIPELTSLQPYSLVVEKDNGNWIILSSTGQGNLIRLNLGKVITNNTPAYKDLGKLGGLGNTLKLDIAKSASRWVGLTTNWSSKKFFLIDFPQADCPFTKAYSYNTDTGQFRSLKSGKHYVTLQAKGSNSLVSSVTKPITISEEQAPQITIENTACFGSPTTFSLTSDTELSSVSWDFDNDGVEDASTAEATYSYPSKGIYKVTVEVQSINVCSNRITKEITIYDPPVPSFTSPAGTTCTNGEVTFTNQTNAQGADDLVSYQWDFNGEGSSTEANPTYVFSSGGAKTVTLTASIPGCSESFSQTINVEQGPVVGFEVPYVCEGREVQFANTTTGMGITTYNWDFGDGGTYTSATATDPFYTYQTPGTYTVTLTVGNALGCNNVFSRQVAVYTQPVADFLAEVACVGMPMQLTDQSTSGTTSNIIRWQWDFGDGKGVANVRNPVYTYQQPGTYQVRLEVTSSAGCIGEVVKEITVATPVTADFTYTLQCHAENNNAYTLQLQDASVASTGNRITQWLWTVNGESFTTPQVNYTFDGPGTYDITLTATAASACSDAITKTVEIFTPPAVAFTYEPACASEAVVFTNTTSDGSDADAINPIADSVTRYTWDFGGVGTSFEVNPQFAFNKAGTYPVRLTVHTKDGCAYRQVQQVEVPAQPQAKFRPSTTRGAYPLTVQFDNQSIQYSQHIWVINGDTLKGQSPDYTFTAAGQYEAWLTVANELGCSHTTSQQIIVVEPVWNVVLENVLVTVSEDGGSYQLVLTVRNAGTLVVEGFPVNVRVDQLIALNEHFGGQIAPGERLNYVVPFTLSANLNAQVSFLCVTLQDKPGAPPDVSANDNRMCINLKDAYSSLAPYPNPVKGQMYLSLILNEAAAVDIQVEDSRGSQVKGQHYTETRKGLNIFNVDMSTLANGLYLIHMRFAGHAKTYRVVVQH